MIKDIIKDEFFLSIPSKDLKEDELYMLDDLTDTLLAHQNTCVGMAGNMIGYSKNIMSMILDNGEIFEMINPIIIEHKDSYKTKEGCLSLNGQRECIRYKKIVVEYYTRDFKKKIKRFKNFEAEIVQHEVDHFFGIII